ncbi:ribose-phosphate diphosphokinase [Tissierella praeacuta]|uniref:Ribose-phosphate pyrophosphokinase n=1 Tax=Tissierella praeacuta DSM 18095 TaxID=1123404 RepID=A0A1M4UN63_9FIRM|nr:ribose-phosphate diphosphokinase [Tissierella praeacuta]TCU68903.1 ribose-phosphate pyrophosphokinase [Tissierella praeacuta]SHE58095.1 ribose-phosphate pyrophosphokinase [Tissierella praeacuta DSM 18095]SUP03516.1 Ribose-phosphate pyrophosphokinase [Tissierella praeacuta]
MNLCMGGKKVFSGNANRELAEKICKELDIPLGTCDVSQFSDGEINVNISETVRGIDVYIVQPTCTPVNDNLMETLILIDAVKRASAGRVNAVIPYYGYARQDRKTKAREPITAKLVANLFTTAGADRVISMDLHAAQIQGYFDIPVDHLSGVPILAEYFKDIVDEETVVVSPDLGGVTRARSFANLLDLPIAIIEKRRPKANVSEVMNVIGDIEGKNVILIDDIIDTAGTITKAASVLKNFGAKKVYGCATHGVLSGPAIERIRDSELEKFIITDTIPIPEEKKIDKIEMVSVAPLFAEAIRRIHDNESVSKLFE